MGNAAAIVNRTIPHNKSKEFASVVPVPPSQPPPVDNSSRPHSRKRKPPVASSSAASSETERVEKQPDAADPVSTHHSITDPAADVPQQLFDHSQTEGQLRRDGMNDCEFECSQITKSLFVGGMRVAENYELLKEKEITRVINCSLSITKNYHEGFPGMSYLGLNLLDGRNEDISWFVCQVIHFILDGADRGEKTLLHCERGISRSCSLAIAFRMWSAAEKWKTAYDYVKTRRKICSPNIAFTCNLIELGEIFHGAAMDATLLFRCAYHGSHDPYTPVLKLCRNRTSRRLLVPALSLLNPRGVFILRAVRDDVHYLFMWQGSESSSDTAARAEGLALQLRKIFTTATVIYKVQQGKEDELFQSFVVMDHAFDASVVEDCADYDDYFDDGGDNAASVCDASVDADALSSLPRIVMSMARESSTALQQAQAQAQAQPVQLQQAPAQFKVSSSPIGHSRPSAGFSNASLVSGLTDAEDLSYSSARSTRVDLHRDDSICLPNITHTASNRSLVDENGLYRAVSGQDILDRVSNIISSATSSKHLLPSPSINISNIPVPTRVMPTPRLDQQVGNSNIVALSMASPPSKPLSSAARSLLGGESSGSPGKIPSLSFGGAAAGAHPSPRVPVSPAHPPTYSTPRKTSLLSAMAHAQERPGTGEYLEQLASPRPSSADRRTPQLSPATNSPVLQRLAPVSPAHPPQEKLPPIGLKLPSVSTTRRPSGPSVLAMGGSGKVNPLSMQSLSIPPIQPHAADPSEPPPSSRIFYSNDLSATADAASSKSSRKKKDDLSSYLTKPLLFVAKPEDNNNNVYEWVALGVYDDDDLDESEIFLLLCPAGSHHIRAGNTFPYSQQHIALDDERRPLYSRLLKWAANVKPGDVRMPTLVGPALITGDVAVHMCGEETQSFWDLFYEGS